MNKILKLAGVAILGTTLAQTVQAIPITGAVGFTGGVTMNSGSANTATAVTSWINPQTAFIFGSFSSIAPGTSANFAPGTWNFNTVAPIMNFWAVGGFTFELLSSSIFSHGGTAGSTAFVVVDGTGIVSGNGYTPTTMNWSFTTQDPRINTNPDTWTFSASTAAAGVPDGGSTALMLGLVLTGAALAQKKFLAC